VRSENAVASGGGGGGEILASSVDEQNLTLTFSPTLRPPPASLCWLSSSHFQLVRPRRFDVGSVYIWYG